MAHTEFSPWRKNLRSMAISTGLSLGAVAVATQLWQAQQPLAALALGAVSLGFASHATRMWRVASNRKFGKTFEQDMTAKAASRMDSAGINYRSNVMIRGLGDIDILVNTADGHLPVEIKSFRKWDQGFFSIGEREDKALEQARRQKAAINSSRAIVWLPQGEATFFQWLFGAGAGRVRVVFGSEKKLVKALKRFGA